MDLIEHWEHMVPFLGNVMGGNTEILLETPERGIVAVSHGILFGHNAGDPLTPQTQRILEKCPTEVWSSDYAYHPQCGVSIRRWHYFLRDEQGQILGVLSFFTDVSKYLDLVAHIQTILGECLPDISVPVIPIEKDQRHGAVSSALLEMGLMDVEPKRLTEAEKQQLVGILDQHGVFEKKGAVSDVAEQLAVSESTVYRYITMSARRKRKEWRESQV